MAGIQKRCDEIVKRLKEDDRFYDILVKLNNYKTNQERIKFVSEIDGVGQCLNTTRASKQKSSDLSVKLRNEGNKFFQKVEYQKALDKYNQSILYAPFQSKNSNDETKEGNAELSYALANRSAVFFHQKDYDLCLSDIESAIYHVYPKHLIYKLHERRAKCYVALGETGKGIKSFHRAISTLQDAELDKKKSENMRKSLEKQLEKYQKIQSEEICEPEMTQNLCRSFHGPLPHITTNSSVFTCASDKIGITNNDESEFGLVATKDVLVGDVLIVEKPYTSIVLPKYGETYCHHCCQRVITVYPCQQCSEVIFCSFKCYKESWDMYHSTECKCLGTVKYADIGLGYLALKMVLKAGYLTVMQYKCNEKEDGCGRTVGMNSDGVYDSADYNTVYSLVNHSEKRTADDLFRRSLHAYFLLQCLEKTDYFTRDGKDVTFDDKCYVAGHILRHVMMLPCNAHEISELQLKPSCLPESETKEIGSGIYPILSLINHSCDPNVVRHSYGEICVVRAIKNISQGEEIVDNYGALYPLTVRSERRKILQPQYYFTCNCKACQEDWPLYFNIPSDVPKFRCIKCGGPVVIPPDRKTENSICLDCQHKQDTTNIVIKLHQSQAEYQNILQQVLRGEQLQEALPKLEKYLQFLYKTVCLPWQDCNNFQEAIKQCYAVQASCCIASS